MQKELQGKCEADVPVRLNLTLKTTNPQQNEMSYEYCALRILTSYQKLLRSTSRPEINTQLREFA